MVVARAKRDCREHVHIVRSQRTSAGETDFNGLAGRLVGALEAGRQGRGVVGDDKIAGAEVIDELGARLVRDATRLVDDEKFRGGRTLDGSIGGGHRVDLDCRERPGDRVDQFSGCGLRPLQRRGVCVRNRHRMERRVHVAGIDREKPHSL